MKDRWIDNKSYDLYKKMLEIVRIPVEYFGEGEKTYQQIQNEKLWAKLRRK